MRYIEKFENAEQIKECAEYYINLLGLQDWKIIFALETTINKEWSGQCESIYDSKCAKITIDNRNYDDLWFKDPQELILIHELIHCKVIMRDNETLENTIVSKYQHQLVDDWARSIFYARYGLTNKDMYF